MVLFVIHSVEVLFQSERNGKQWYSLPLENESLIGLMSFPYTEITDGNQVILTC